MALVRDILDVSRRRVHSVGPTASVLDAALLMNELRIGSLIVLADGELAGIITERDILQRVVAARRDPAEMPVGAIMTPEVICCQLSTDLDEARTIMKERRVRHLPVLDENRRLLGMISIGDLNAQRVHEQEGTIHNLESYIQGRV